MLSSFGVSISDVYGRITWGQYRDLLMDLADDPQSRLAAELRRWPHRLSAAWLSTNTLAAIQPETPWPWDSVTEDPPTDHERDWAQERLARYGGMGG